MLIRCIYYFVEAFFYDIKYVLLISATYFMDGQATTGRGCYKTGKDSLPVCEAVENFLEIFEKRQLWSCRFISSRGDAEIGLMRVPGEKP